MKKVVLIKPYYIGTDSKSLFNAIPMGLLSLATSLNNSGIGVKIVDTMLDGNYWEKILDELDDAVFVGITAMTTQVTHGLEIAQKIKAVNSKLPIVWGGIHPSLYPQYTMESAFCDVVIDSEGDDTIVDIFTSITENKTFENVKGLYFKTASGDIKGTGKRVLIEKVPKLNYELLDNLESYINTDLSPIAHGTVRSLQVHAGRGCYYGCTFCAENINKMHRGKDPDELLKEINELIEKYSLEYIDMQDSDFFARKKDVKRFVEIASSNYKPFKWFSNCRANYFNNTYINDTFIKELEDSGCVRLGMGIESGSDIMLKKMKKRITVNSVKQCIRTMNKTSMQSSFSFLIGMPGETIKDMSYTLSLIIYILKSCKKFYFIGPAIFRPYPGSEMYNEVVGMGYKSPKTLEEWANQDFDRHGYVNQKHFTWQTKKTEVMMDYVRSITDYWHFKKRVYTYPLYLLYSTIICFRLKYCVLGCLVEHHPLHFTRKILEKLRSKGWGVSI